MVPSGSRLLLPRPGGPGPACSTALACPEKGARNGTQPGAGSAGSAVRRSEDLGAESLSAVPERKHEFLEVAGIGSAVSLDLADGLPRELRPHTDARAVPHTTLWSDRIRRRSPSQTRARGQCSWRGEGLTARRRSSADTRSSVLVASVAGIASPTLRKLPTVTPVGNQDRVREPTEEPRRVDWEWQEGTPVRWQAARTRCGRGQGRLRAAAAGDGGVGG